MSRLIPTSYMQPQLRRIAGTDLAPNPGRPSGRDDYGFDEKIRKLRLTPDSVQRNTLAIVAAWIAYYRPSLEGEEPSRSAVRSVRDLLTLCRMRNRCLRSFCRRRRMCQIVRAVAPEMGERRFAELTKIGADHAVGVIDARSWLDDADFGDGIHLSPIGAEHYSARFGRDALTPALAGLRGPSPGAPDRTVTATPVSQPATSR